MTKSIRLLVMFLFCGLAQAGLPDILPNGYITTLALIIENGATRSQLEEMGFSEDEIERAKSFLRDQQEGKKRPTVRPNLRDIMQWIEGEAQEDAPLPPGCRKFIPPLERAKNTCKKAWKDSGVFVSLPAKQTKKDTSRFEVLFESSDDEIYDSSDDKDEEEVRSVLPADPALLFFYAQEGNLERLKELYKKGVDVFIKDQQGLSIREFAARGFMSIWDKKAVLYPKEPGMPVVPSRELDRAYQEMGACTKVIKWYDSHRV